MVDLLLDQAQVTESSVSVDELVKIAEADAKAGPKKKTASKSGTRKKTASKSGTSKTTGKTTPRKKTTKTAD